MDDGWGPVTAIRLDWKVGEIADGKDWECGENHGTTGFDLPEGMADLRVTPECGDRLHRVPAAQDTYIAPAIVQRVVMRGETVSLGAVELIVVVSGCRAAGVDNPNRGPQPCICTN